MPLGKFFNAFYVLKKGLRETVYDIYLCPISPAGSADFPLNDMEQECLYRWFTQLPVHDIHIHRNNLQKYMFATVIMFYQ